MSEPEPSLSQLREWIDQTNREVVRDVTTETQGGDTAHGVVFDHGGRELAGFAVPGTKYYQLIYEYSVVGDLAVKFYIEDLDFDPPDGAGAIQIEPDPSDTHVQQAEQAVRDKFASADGDTIADLQTKLTQELSVPEAAFEMKQDLGGPYGFALKRKVFPEVETVADFDHTVQRLVSYAIPPQQLFGKIFDTQPQLESSAEESDGVDRGSIGFQ